MIIFTIFYSVSFAEESLIPDEFEYEGSLYQRCDWLKEYERIKYADLDGDGEDEAVAIFTSSLPDVFLNTCFCLIYDFIGNKPTLTKAIALEGYTGLTGVDIIDLKDKSGNGNKGIVLYASSGAHCSSVFIFRYQKEEYGCIASYASPCGVGVTQGTNTPLVSIGRENWGDSDWCYAEEPLYEVHTWNGEEFVYNPKLSSYHEATNEEQFQGYYNRFMEYLEKSKDEAQ